MFLKDLLRAWDHSLSRCEGVSSWWLRCAYGEVKGEAENKVIGLERVR